MFGLNWWIVSFHRDILGDPVILCQVKFRGPVGYEIGCDPASGVRTAWQASPLLAYYRPCVPSSKLLMYTVGMSP